MTTLTKIDTKRLNDVAAATNENKAFFATKKEMTKLINGGFVIFNEGLVDPADATKIGFRTTEAGTALLASPPTPAPEQPRPQFTIDDGIPVPEIARGGGRKESVYPFELLALGQSFFIPATEEIKDPAKKYASTVSTATKRFNKPDDRRKFIIRTVDETAQGRGKGARVWRVMPDDPAPAADPAAGAAAGATA